ncbi:MAG: hypothetical protein J6V83_03410 [Clostridia bacterium]|nr:hypothetical protein [Clostridia bacterium]MBO7156434.1 hypothetical protein [Clostridia bacterium]
MHARDRLLESLYKRAEGYSVEETVTEFVYEEDGSKRAVREKTQNKYMPPDVTAAKFYLEFMDFKSELDNMSDEDLENEKMRLIALLKD